MAQYREIFEAKGARFVVRNAVGADAPRMFDFMEHVDRETTFLAREPGEFAESYTVEQEAELLESWAGSGDFLFLLAEAEDGTIAATCNCFFSSARKRARHKAELAVSVRQDYWRMGLGRRMMEIQMDWCRENGIKKLCLEVDTRNTRALGLYLSCGFTVEGTLRGQQRMADGSFRDLYAMAKFFD